jgi:hypothetical protein
MYYKCDKIKETRKPFENKINACLMEGSKSAANTLFNTTEICMCMVKNSYLWTRREKWSLEGHHTGHPLDFSHGISIVTHIM